MKSLKLITAGIILLASTSIQAQISVNVNIGSPPSWGPVGYESVDYYYLPDVEAYYDIRASQFIYFGQRGWIRASYLPRQYRNYDLYSGYKVVLNDYHGHSPYSHFKQHKVKYYRGYHGRPQRNISDRHDNHRDHDDDDHRDRDDRHNHDKHKNRGNNGRGHGRDKD